MVDVALPSVCSEIYLVKPDVVWRLCVIPIHLEGDVDLFQRPVWLVGVVGIDRVSLIPNRETYVVDLVADALDVPDQMNPRVRRKRCTGHGRGFPAVDVVPDVPLTRAVKVALGTPHPTLAAKGLIEVKLQCLRRSRVVDIEVQVVSEMAHSVATANRIPIQLVGIWRGTAHGELRRLAVHGGTGLIRRHSGLRGAYARRADLPVAARA